FQRLDREIRVWLQLKHINIVPLLGTTKGFGWFPAMVCPWLENGTVTSYLKRWDNELTAVKRLDLLLMCNIWPIVHSWPIVHGDLSGSNVLIDANGSAYIADFGLSTLLTELEGLSSATSLRARGTLRWAAPELFDLDENSTRISPTLQSDVYSFGGIMLQVLTGKVPYHYYGREGQIIRAISEGKTPQRPSQELITDHQWWFMQQCWSSLDGDQSRPSVEDIVKFLEHELSKYKV
ncbi:kinase-like domain-containing protein, partial [Melanogaster broomeanus]